VEKRVCIIAKWMYILIYNISSCMLSYVVHKYLKVKITRKM